MLGTICGIQNIMISKDFSFGLKDLYNACMNLFLDYEHT